MSPTHDFPQDFSSHICKILLTFKTKILVDTIPSQPFISSFICEASPLLCLIEYLVYSKKYLSKMCRL